MRRSGVAAETLLSFELETARGAPASAVLAVGTRAQSVPAQDELPQTFETVEEIEARPEWNAIGVRTTAPTRSADGATELFLAGTATNLRPGDILLLAGKSDKWQVRRVKRLHEDLTTDRTRVTLNKELDFPPDFKLGPGSADVRVSALRVRTALFGHNAPDWKAMPEEVKQVYDPVDNPVDHSEEWPELTVVGVSGSAKAVVLDALYPQIADGSWAVLRAPGEVDVRFTVDAATEDARTAFTLSARTTRLDLSAEVPQGFEERVRDTTVFTGGEELELAEWPVTTAVSGAQLQLGGAFPRVPEGRRLVVSGIRARARLQFSKPWLKLHPDDGSSPKPVEVGDVFELLGPFELVAGKAKWHVLNAAGVAGILPVAEQHLVLLPPPDDAPVLVESVTTSVPITGQELQDTLHLATALEHVYDPASVRIAANVARATHGESRRELLGGGEASRPFQRFTLRDSPVTYVQTSGATGAATTLVVRVNGVRWREVRALYGHGPRERVYVARTGEDGKAALEFGDGTTGARVPTGTQNLRAEYRVGTGLAGQVDAGRLTTPMGVPLGVKAVTNPFAAVGAADPEPPDRARRNAPLTVKTFERIVSLQDVEDFALAFAGIGKAQATRLWDGEAEIVHVTVAADDGTPPEPGSPTMSNLRQAVRDAGDPHVRVQIDPYIAYPFAVEASVFVERDHEAASVLAAVRESLADVFSFERRSFAQSVAESEVIAAIQRVEGVEGVGLQWLHLLGEYTLLPAERARFFAGKIIPAQLLTLAPDQVKVTAS